MTGMTPHSIQLTIIGGLDRRSPASFSARAPLPFCVGGSTTTTTTPPPLLKVAEVPPMNSPHVCPPPGIGRCHGATVTARGSE